MQRAVDTLFRNWRYLALWSRHTCTHVLQHECHLSKSPPDSGVYMYVPGFPRATGVHLGHLPEVFGTLVLRGGDALDLHRKCRVAERFIWSLP